MEINDAWIIAQVTVEVHSFFSHFFFFPGFAIETNYT